MLREAINESSLYISQFNIFSFKKSSSIKLYIYIFFDEKLYQLFQLHLSSENFPKCIQNDIWGNFDINGYLLTFHFGIRLCFAHINYLLVISCIDKQRKVKVYYNEFLIVSRDNIRNPYPEELTQLCNNKK